MINFHVFRTPKVSESPIRTIYEVLNGQLDVRNIKLIDINPGQKFSGHSHFYPEARLVLRGHVHYELREMTPISKVVTLDLFQGDVLILGPYVYHVASTGGEGCTMIDFSSIGFISSGFNNIV